MRGNGPPQTRLDLGVVDRLGGAERGARGKFFASGKLRMVLAPLPVRKAEVEIGEPTADRDMADRWRPGRAHSPAPGWAPRTPPGPGPGPPTAAAPDPGPPPRPSAPGQPRRAPDLHRMPRRRARAELTATRAHPARVRRVATQQVFSSTRQRAVRLDVPHGPDPPRPRSHAPAPSQNAPPLPPQCHYPDRS